MPKLILNGDLSCLLEVQAKVNDISLEKGVSFSKKYRIVLVLVLVINKIKRLHERYSHSFWGWALEYPTKHKFESNSVRPSSLLAYRPKIPVF